MLLQAVDFPQPAAHSVPDHRVAQLGSRGQAQPVFPPAVFRQYRTMVGETALRPLA